MIQIQVFYIHGSIIFHKGWIRLNRWWLNAGDNDLGIAFAVETGFRLETNPDTVLAPDIGLVASEHLPGGPLPKGYFPGSPDLVVEVVSPGDRVSDLLEKVQDWLSSGQPGKVV